MERCCNSNLCEDTWLYVLSTIMGGSIMCESMYIWKQMCIHARSHVSSTKYSITSKCTGNMLEHVKHGWGQHSVLVLFGRVVRCLVRHTGFRGRVPVVWCAVVVCRILLLFPSFCSSSLCVLCCCSSVSFSLFVRCHSSLANEAWSLFHASPSSCCFCVALFSFLSMLASCLGVHQAPSCTILCIWSIPIDMISCHSCFLLSLCFLLEESTVAVWNLADPHHFLCGLCTIRYYRWDEPISCSAHAMVQRHAAWGCHPRYAYRFNFSECAKTLRFSRNSATKPFFSNQRFWQAREILIEIKQLRASKASQHIEAALAL